MAGGPLPPDRDGHGIGPRGWTCATGRRRRSVPSRHRGRSPAGPRPPVGGPGAAGCHVVGGEDVDARRDRRSVLLGGVEVPPRSDTAIVAPAGTPSGGASFHLVGRRDLGGRE